MQVFRRIKTQPPQTTCTFPTGTNASASTHKRDFFSALNTLRPPLHESSHAAPTNELRASERLTRGKLHASEPLASAAWRNDHTKPEPRKRLPRG